MSDPNDIENKITRLQKSMEDIGCLLWVILFILLGWVVFK